VTKMMLAIKAKILLHISIIKAGILCHIWLLKQEQAECLLERDSWPVNTLAYERLNLGYAIQGMKVAFWEAII